MHPRIHFARAIPGISSITYGQLIDIQAYYCHLKIVSLTTLHKPMPRATSISRLAAMLIAASGFFAGSANAAEYLALNSPVYKLSLDGGDASAAKVPAAVVPEPPVLFPVSISLAARPYAKLIEHAAREAALDPALVHAVISVESAYNATARSPAGAIGLMQLMPDTALRYGVKDPARSLEGNLRAGTQYLRDLMRLFNGRLDLVLAAYNAGENAVIKYGQKIPPYAETQAYVPAVLAKYREWRVALPSAPVEAKETSAGPKRIEYMPGTVLNVNALRAEGYR